MASGLPVVGTSLSVEGLEVAPGKHALVSETAEDLAKNTIQLLKSQKLQKELALNGKNLVAKKYNWKAISLELDRVYQELGKKHN